MLSAGIYIAFRRLNVNKFMLLRFVFMFW